MPNANANGIFISFYQFIPFQWNLSFQSSFQHSTNLIDKQNSWFCREDDFGNWNAYETIQFNKIKLFYQFRKMNWDLDELRKL